MQAFRNMYGKNQPIYNMEIPYCVKAKYSI